MLKIIAAIFSFTLLLPLSAAAAAHGPALKPFSSDGCSLFPDGTAKDRALWCGCCFTHDIAYWQGGTAAEREKADIALRDCVLERTKDKKIAETMYAGVRAGGHPVSVMWYRWGYGWPAGRGYQALTYAEKLWVDALLADYRFTHPSGYCAAPAKSTAAPSAQQRPAAWAAPVQARRLKNFYKLDGKVYRSAQPDAKGFGELEKLGVRNILNLRDYHTGKPGKGSKLNLYRVEMRAGKITGAQVIDALRFIRNSQGPVLIHCWHGSDRTGTVAAMYRIVFQGWTKEAAIDELVNGGYGFHTIYKNIPELIRGADIEAIKREVFAEGNKNELP